MPYLLLQPLDQNPPTPAPLRRPLRRTRSLVALFLSFVAAAPAAVDRPNILWIVMDDVGSEFPCYGERAIQTPHIDRLVREGTKFDRAFLTAPVCSTTRSALITGMYQTTIGAHHHQSGRGQHKIPLPLGVEPVPAILQRAGYYTCNGDFPAKGRGAGKTDYNFSWDTTIYHGSDWAGAGQVSRFSRSCSSGAGRTATTTAPGTANRLRVNWENSRRRSPCNCPPTTRATRCCSRTGLSISTACATATS